MVTRHFHAFIALTFAISWGLPGLGLFPSRLELGFPFSLEMYSPSTMGVSGGQPWPPFSDDCSTGGIHCAGGCSRCSGYRCSIFWRSWAIG